MKRFTALLMTFAVIIAAGCASSEQKPAVQPARVDDVDAALARGNEYADKGLTTEAEAYYLGAIRIAPTDTRAYVNLGQLYIRENRIDEAIQTLSAAVRINPGEARAYNELGNIHYDRKAYLSAYEHYQRALIADPSRYDTHWNLIGTCFALNRDIEAYEHCRIFVELAPDSERANIERAQRYLSGNRP